MRSDTTPDIISDKFCANIERSGCYYMQGGKKNLNFKHKRHQNNTNCNGTPIQTDIDCWNTTTIKEEGGKHSTLEWEILIAHYTVCTQLLWKLLQDQ